MTTYFLEREKMRMHHTTPTPHWLGVRRMNRGNETWWNGNGNVMISWHQRSITSNDSEGDRRCCQIRIRRPEKEGYWKIPVATTTSHYHSHHPDPLSSSVFRVSLVLLITLRSTFIVIFSLSLSLFFLLLVITGWKRDGNHSLSVSFPLLFFMHVNITCFFPSYHSTQREEKKNSRSTTNAHPIILLFLLLLIISSPRVIWSRHSDWLSPLTHCASCYVKREGKVENDGVVQEGMEEK